MAQATCGRCLGSGKIMGTVTRQTGLYSDDREQMMGMIQCPSCRGTGEDLFRVRASSNRSIVRHSAESAGGCRADLEFLSGYMLFAALTGAVTYYISENLKIAFIFGIAWPITVPFAAFVRLLEFLEYLR